MLALTTCSTPLTVTGSCRAALIRSATRTASRPVGLEARLRGEALFGAVRAIPGLHDDDELVAADPCDGVVLAQHVVEPLGDLEQQGVPGGMARDVVDPLEAVQVAEQHGDLSPVARRPGESGLEPVHQQGPVRQPGEAVVQGSMGEAVLGLHHVADVANDAKHLHDGTGRVAAERGDAPAQPVPLPVGVLRAVAQLQHLPVLQVGRRRVDRLQPRLVVGVDEPGHRLGSERLELVGLDAEDVLVPRGVDEGAGRQVGHEGEVRGGRQDRVEERVRALGGLLRNRQVGDVEVRAVHAQRLAVAPCSTSRVARSTRSAPSAARRIRNSWICRPPPRMAVAHELSAAARSSSWISPWMTSLDRPPGRRPTSRTSGRSRSMRRSRGRTRSRPSGRVAEPRSTGAVRSPVPSGWRPVR